MIDLSALGLAAAQASPQTGKQQNGGHGHGHADDAKSFDDLIDAAGKKAAQKGTGHHAKDEAADDLAADADKIPVHRKLQTIDLRTVPVDAPAASAAEKNGAQAETAQQGRIDISSDLQQILKGKAGNGAADKGKLNTGELAEQAEDAATGAQNTGAKLPAASKDAASRPADPKLHADPAQELRAMLEPAHSAAEVEHSQHSDDGKVARKDKRDDNAEDAKDTGDAKAEVPNGANVAASRVDTAVIAQAVPHHAVTLDASRTADGDAADTHASDTNRKIDAALPDGKARASDVELSESKHADSARSASDDKTDFVTVLDSRRYLGFSSDAPVSGNAHALADAIKTEPSLAKLINDVKSGGAQHATATEVNTLKLQMSPEHLGNMTASLRLKGDELSVEVRVETVDAYRQLSQDHDGLVKALKEHGFSIDQVSIQLAPSSRADSGQAGGNQSQSGNGQQSLQDGSQGDTARQRDDGARRNPNQNNWTGNERTASFGDTGDGTDDTRSGNLYL